VIQLCYIGEIPENEYQPWFYQFSTGAYLINQKGAQTLKINSQTTIPQITYTGGFIVVRYYLTARGFWDNQVEPNSAGKCHLTYNDGTSQDLIFDTGSYCESGYCTD
jgi:hypothetical protein